MSISDLLCASSFWSCSLSLWSGFCGGSSLFSSGLFLVVLLRPGHVEAGEKMLHDLREAALILYSAREPVEISAGALLDKTLP